MIVYPRSIRETDAMVSFGQNREDVLIDRVFRKKTGFFIDVGAGDPVDDSVTKYFSLCGWHGINIEPDADSFEGLRRNRPNEINLRCAIGRERGSAVYHRLPVRGLSTISAEQLALLDESQRAGVRTETVELRTLADVCAEFVTGEIDFLTIDVEGAEGDVIAGADWERFRPRLLVIEATRPWSSELRCPWEPHLLAQGYLFQHFDGINRYYLRREDEALAEQLSVPVNVLDMWIPYRETLVRRELEHRKAELQHLRRTVPSIAGSTLNLPTVR